MDVVEISRYISKKNIVRNIGIFLFDENLSTSPPPRPPKAPPRPRTPPDTPPPAQPPPCPPRPPAKKKNQKKNFFFRLGGGGGGGSTQIFKIQKTFSRMITPEHLYFKSMNSMPILPPPPYFKNAVESVTIPNV